MGQICPAAQSAHLLGDDGRLGRQIGLKGVGKCVKGAADRRRDRQRGRVARVKEAVTRPGFRCGKGFLALTVGKSQNAVRVGLRTGPGSSGDSNHGQ